MLNYKTTIKTLVISVVIFIFSLFIYPNILLSLTEVKSKNSELGEIKYRVWVWDKNADLSYSSSSTSTK